MDPENAIIRKADSIEKHVEDHIRDVGYLEYGVQGYFQEKMRSLRKKRMDVQKSLNGQELITYLEKYICNVNMIPDMTKVYIDAIIVERNLETEIRLIWSDEMKKEYETKLHALVGERSRMQACNENNELIIWLSDYVQRVRALADELRDASSIMFKADNAEYVFKWNILNEIPNNKKPTYMAKLEKFRESRKRTRVLNEQEMNTWLIAYIHDIDQTLSEMLKENRVF